LSNVYDSIDLFGKTAQRENVIEKLKEVGKIQVQESDENFLTSKICRKCFRKVTGLGKAIDDFRKICLQSKEIQIAGLDNARLKCGRKPSTPTKEPLGKRRPTVPTEFTTQHRRHTKSNSYKGIEYCAVGNSKRHCQRSSQC